MSRKFNILIAEDDNISLAYLKIILAPITDRLITASNGLEAIERFKTNPDIDLILMDIKMPVMNGFDATQAIRKLNKNTLIIAQTACVLAGDREKAIKMGCNDYIPKPIDRSELSSIINAHMVQSLD